MDLPEASRYEGCNNKFYYFRQRPFSNTCFLKRCKYLTAFLDVTAYICLVQIGCLFYTMYAFVLLLLGFRIAHRFSKDDGQFKQNRAIEK